MATVLSALIRREIKSKESNLGDDLDVDIHQASLHGDKALKNNYFGYFSNRQI
jgi:hypothetical protein